MANFSTGVPSVGHRMSSGFRSLFYLITPQESSFEHFEDVPRYLDRATPYFLTLVVTEIILQIALGRKDLLFRFNDAMSSASSGIISLLPLMIAENIEVTTYIYVYENYRLYELPWDSWQTWALCFILTDFVSYWIHRLAHEVNFMWAGHQTHHSSEDFNLLMALRQSALKRHYQWIFFLPMAPFVPASVFVAHLELNLVYQYWIHTNLVGKLWAPIEFFLSTPSHHRVHHGRNRYCIDKNYGTVLIIWDRLFGTFEEEREDEPIAYGLVHPINSWDATYIQLGHWQHMITTAWNMKGIGNKLSVFFKGPGWEPGKPRLGNYDEIPDIRAPQPKYSKDLGVLMTAYAWIHFALVVIIFQYTNSNKLVLDYNFVVCSVAAMFWSLANIGFFYEHKAFAPFSELLRCLVLLAVDSYFYSDKTGILFSAVRLFFVASVVVNTYQCIPRKQKIP